MLARGFRSAERTHYVRPCRPGSARVGRKHPRMSLINDALRKASQNPAPSGPAETKEPLHVASHQPPPRWPMFVVPPLVALVFAAGTFLVMRGWQSGRP